MSDTLIRKEQRGSSGGGGSGDSSTMNTSMSTLLSDPHNGLFHHSITDLDSFSTSLDFDRHLPSVEAREDFLSNLMNEEEINPEDEESLSFQSSFAYDDIIEPRNFPERLGTILDQSEAEDEDEGGGGGVVQLPAATTRETAAGCCLSKSSHHHHHRTGESAKTKAKT